MSARHSLLRLPFTINHWRLRHQYCAERQTWTTEGNDFVLTEEFCFCLKLHDSRIRVLRHLGERMLNCCVMHFPTDPVAGIKFGGDIGFHCRTTLVRIAVKISSQRLITEVLENMVLPYIQLQPYVTVIMRDHSWHAMFKSSSLPIRLNCFLGLLVLPVYH
ncbi:transposable element Tcb1 transposase [Trichonephila clavipes]|nr:transposable element Tcb1 transposase [Trichonephila clavipes]